MHTIRMLLVTSSLLGLGGLAQADEKHPFNFPGSDTSVTVGGYAKLDALWSDTSAGVDSVGDQVFNPGLIPVGPSAGQHKTSQVTMHARQSRLWLGTTTPTSRGELRTYLEGDFFGADGNESSSNSHGFRLRQAYGSLGKLLAGQTWTNLFDERVYPETLDFGGPAGQIFVRQAQVRWTEPLGVGDWSVSAENPESVLAVPGSATPFRSDADHAPDLTVRLRLRAGRGTYSLGAVAREIGVDSPAAPAASGAQWGGAVVLGAIQPIGSRDDLRMDLNFGNAIGRYQELGFFPDGYVGADGTLRLARQASGYVAYRHFWSPSLRSTLELSAAGSTPPRGTANGVNVSDRSQHLNLIWSPVAAVNLGAELIHGKRTVVGGDDGSLNRLQVSAQYIF
jgi:hypothetical protein